MTNRRAAAQDNGQDNPGSSVNQPPPFLIKTYVLVAVDLAVGARMYDYTIYFPLVQQV